MNTLIFINADRSSDDKRHELLDKLIQDQAQLQLWFYDFDQDLSEFHQPVDNHWERAQLWIHVSAFEDEQTLLSWIQNIHHSWLEHNHLVFYSGGGLKDCQALELNHWLEEQNLSHEVFKPSFPSSATGSGYLQLLQHLQWLSSGFDPRQRTKQATSFLINLSEGESAISLQPQFDALSQLYPPNQQAELQTSWQAYLDKRLSIQAFKTVLFGSVS